jgi:uncharacterized lipoprotein YbaY
MALAAFTLRNATQRSSCTVPPLAFTQALVFARICTIGTTRHALNRRLTIKHAPLRRNAELTWALVVVSLAHAPAIQIRTGQEVLVVSLEIA